MRNFRSPGHPQRKPKQVLDTDCETDRSFIVRRVPAGTLAKMHGFSYMPQPLTDAKTPDGVSQYEWKGWGRD